MNVIWTSFAKENEAQNQTTERKDQLFNVLEKSDKFYHDHTVKGCFCNWTAKLKLFFVLPL
jgi:hypothetical protein